MSQKINNFQPLTPQIQRVSTGRPEVFLMTLVPDDSGSIKHRHNDEPIRLGHNQMMQNFRADPRRDALRVTTRYLNGYTLNDSCHPQHTKDMIEANYNPDGSTPLYYETVKILKNVERQAEELVQAGYDVFTFTYIMTDGDDSGKLGATPGDVRVVVERMLASGTHIIAGIGISDGRTSFQDVFRSMGIQDRWIEVLENDREVITESVRSLGLATSRSLTRSEFTQTSTMGFGGDQANLDTARIPGRGRNALQAEMTQQPSQDDLEAMVQPRIERVTRIPDQSDLEAMVALPQAESTPELTAGAAPQAWSPAQSPKELFKYMPEVSSAVPYVLQFPEDVETIVVGRHDASRGLKEKNVMIAEMIDPSNKVSRRHIKVRRLGKIEKWWKGGMDYEISLLDKIDPAQELYVTIDGDFMINKSTMVKSGSVICLAKGVYFLLGLPQGKSL